MGCSLIALELWHLKRFCDKHGLDYQLIDDSLTYSENKEYLKTLRLPPTLFELETLNEWADVLKEAKSMEIQYMREHMLTCYIMAQREGKTKSEEMGPPIPHYPRFSLETFVQQTS